jgi:hypothetical protein
MRNVDKHAVFFASSPDPHVIKFFLHEHPEHEDIESMEWIYKG